MKTSIISRLEKLEVKKPRSHTKEDFKNNWDNMDSLSKSFFELQAVKPSLVNSSNEQGKLINSWIMEIDPTFKARALSLKRDIEEVMN